MNCATCNAPLAPNARFCSKCGATIAQFAPAQPSPLYQPTKQGDAATIPPARQQQPVQWPPAQPQQREQWPPPQPRPQQQPAQWPPSQQPQAAPGQLVLPPSQQAQSAPVPAPIYKPANAPEPGKARPKRRRGRGLLYTLITLLVIAIILVGGWFLGVRPYIDSMAQSKLNDVMTKAVNNIPAQIALLPSGPVAIPESALNNLLVLESSPSDIVKNPKITITEQNFRFDFQVYGFSNSITGVPAVSNGKLIVDNLSISGIAGFIMTTDELTTIVNNHLSDAVTRINHSITAVTLKNHELDLTLGPRGSGSPPVTPTGIPTSIPTNIPTSIPTGLPTGLP